ncbi:MAG: alanine racemase [Candidatus Kerfeldbacteria bacterium]|nr:alanine racemase [Candidatus Kerfeldbacteria bacterium]
MVERRTWVEIHQRSLHSNLLQYQRLLPKNVKIAPVIKANAYGHGTLVVVQTLKKSPIWGFCVASGEEALELRQHFSRRILVLSSWQPRELPDLIRARIDLVVWDTAAARQAHRIATRIGTRARVHAKIDTGAGRIGVLPDAAPTFLNELQRFSGIKLAGVFTHFAAVEENQIRFTQLQLRRFREVTQSLPPSVERHTASTAAITRARQSWHSFVRLGIGLYGLWPSAATKRYARRDRLGVSLTPVLSWKTHVLQVKRIPRGTTVGYGRTFHATRPTTLGIIPIGYWDGFDRSLSNNGAALVRGKRVRVAGRVSMNLTMLDLTDLPNPRPGDLVTLIGENGRASVTAEAMAAAAGTINYEVVTRINPRIPRILV